VKRNLMICSMQLKHMDCLLHHHPRAVIQPRILKMARTLLCRHHRRSTIQPIRNLQIWNLSLLSRWALSFSRSRIFYLSSLKDPVWPFLIYKYWYYFKVIFQKLIINLKIKDLIRYKYFIKLICRAVKVIRWHACDIYIYI
jgi:hypothetical protein